MVETEQYFPRGGKKPKSQFIERKKFDFLGNADRAGKKKKYRLPRKKVEDEDFEDGHLSDRSVESNDGSATIKSVSAEAISLKTIQEGMIILGRVMQIHDTKVIVSLPSKIAGVVMANSISTPYTNLLKAFVEGNIEDIKKLNYLFRIGEYVSVKVVSVSFDKDHKSTIRLSLMPQDINSGIYFSALKEGMLLRAAVSSVEDHGCVLDLGIANTRAFMPKKYSDESLSLDVGQVIWTVIKKCQTSGNNSIVTLTNSLKSIKSSSISGNALQNCNVNQLRPGMALGFSMSKPLPDGAEGMILKDSVGYIHVSQIDSKLKLGQKVNARVLYVMPVSKLPFLTTRKIFEELRPDIEKEFRLKVGQFCENARVTKVTKSAVILKMSKHEIGIIHLNTYNENVEEKYPLGSEHKVRILKYCLSDYAYLCSDDENVLRQKYFGFSDLTVGEYVDAIVEEIRDNFILVKVGELRGKIQDFHLSEVGVVHQDKKPGAKVTECLIKKKFKPGQEIRTRVLKVNPSISVLYLTVKPSFMDPDASILCHISDAKVGRQYKGLILCHMKFGILVGFFNDVKAFVHISQMSHDYIKDIPSAFHLGQIVNCTILSIDEDKMTGSLIKEPEEYEQKDENNPLNVEKSKSKKRKKENVDNNEANGVVKMKLKKDDKMEADDKVSKKKKKKSEMNDDNCEGNKKIIKKHIDSQDDIDLETSATKKKKKKILKDTEDEFENLESNKKQNNKLSDSQDDTGIDANTLKKKKKKDKKADTNNVENSKRIKKDNEGPIKKKQKLDPPAGGKIKTEIVDDVKNANSHLRFSSMSGFFNLDATTIVKNISKRNDESSSESDDEKDSEHLKKKKKKLSAAEKVEKARKEEEELRAIEKELADSSCQPKSSDQFERLLLANPNSSELWIAYMAFHLQATEIEKARSVGDKALKTISFREEHDKLNVWLALLNLENRFGTQESLATTLQQALQMNDPFSVHSKMLDMYVDTGKIQEVLSLVDLMVSKYRTVPQAYIVTGSACFKINSVDKARSIMQKAVNRLEYKTHVPILIKFAQMENNRGDSERAEALFEQIVGCLPNRVDIWCTYVDMLVKSKKIDSVRLVLERAVSQKLPLKKMKLLYKKWVEIEEKLSDSEQVEKVRRMALDYINKIKC